MTQLVKVLVISINQLCFYLPNLQKINKTRPKWLIVQTQFDSVLSVFEQPKAKVYLQQQPWLEKRTALKFYKLLTRKKYILVNIPRMII